MRGVPPPITDPERQIVQISQLDHSILLYNCLKAAAHPDVGHNDADQTLDYFIAKYDKMVTTVSLKDLEILCYSSNMLSEVRDFWHFRNLPIEQFLKKVFSRFRNKYEYETFYNYIYEKKEGKNGT